MISMWILGVMSITHFSLVSVGRCEMFTSIAHLQEALYAEKDIASVIKDYVQTEEKRLKELKRIAEDMTSHSSKALANPDLFINPIDAFLFIKRFTLDWDNNVHKLIEDNENVDKLRRFVAYCKQALPDDEDLEGAVAALKRLQDTYKLDTADIAQGNLRGSKCSELTASDCFELGKIYCQSEDYIHASQWMSQTLGQLKAEDKLINNTLQLDALRYLSYSEYMIGNVDKALIVIDEILEIEPEHEWAVINRQYYEEQLQEKVANDLANEENVITENNEHPSNDSNNTDTSYKKTEEFEAYEALCRGESVKEIVNKHKLRCRYRTRDNPLLILSPVKEEDLYLNPWIAVYHDVISDSEIETLKEKAKPELQRAVVFARKAKQNKPANYRISKSAWLYDDDSPVISKLSTRVEAITGLSMDTAEALQVGNYGIGGQYEPHYDAARKDEVHGFGDLGNRIATFMFYMSTVEEGATVFPLIGVRIPPIKGAAAFWYNLHKNGESIEKTLHAGCPVLVGTKWVSNKWLHERGQEFIRPCGLLEEE